MSAVIDYQLTRAKLGRMVVLIQAGRQFAYAVAMLMAKGEGAMEASMVKAYVCKAAEWVTREAMQIHGGMGYAEEFPVSRLFVDARVLSIFEGADETLCLRVIARQLTTADRLTAPFVPDPSPRDPSGSSGGEFVGEFGERADPLEVGVRDGRRTGRRGSGAARRPSPTRCPSSPSRRRRRSGRGRCSAKCTSAWSKIAGSGFATPTTSLSTMHAHRHVRDRAPTWQISRASTRFDLAAGVRHHAHRHARRGEPVERGPRLGDRPTATAVRGASRRAASVASTTSASATPTERT